MDYSVPTIRVKSGNSFATINADDFDEKVHTRYVADAACAMPPPPPPPAPVAKKPGDDMPEDWREMPLGELRTIVEKRTGRIPENRRQAVQMLEQALGKVTLIVTPADSDANSYATLLEADDYFEARGITTWTGTDAVKEAALIRAAFYLENQYRGRWIGRRSTADQALAWPRVEGTYYFQYVLTDSDGFEIPFDTVPVQVKNAQIEAALLYLTGKDLEASTDRGGMIKSIGKSVGPLRKDITYMDGAPGGTQYLAIDGLLRGLVSGSPGSSSSNVRLIRG